ncbi:MAG: hypothetical protein GC146_03715 [Limimaricola sp.]|uniref:ceramidase domain-containing protein n=1 Tax=Limimaricola sp. TaxID=2211665 RepID=UPI001DD816F3|nr:ceramidase domain-containing protein [Limimaricola sp.]MBI1416308.1 hypothetical protein [Limimaricola sp.]
MDWTQKIDGYCERTGPAFWAEPVNALTNLAFLVVAVLMWRLAGRDATGRALSAVLFAIGLGSFLFHTEATAWASLADTIPIAVFILFYLFAVNRDVLGLRPGWSALATAGFFPYAALVVAVLARVPFLRISAAYWTVPLLLVIYTVALRRRWPVLARGFLVGAGLLSASLVARSLDMVLCPVWPLGTHFLWHLLNAVMLGWMIAVLLDHRATHPLATGGG